MTVVLIFAGLTLKYRASPAIRARGRLFLGNLFISGCFLIFGAVMHAAVASGAIVPLHRTYDKAYGKFLRVISAKCSALLMCFSAYGWCTKIKLVVSFVRSLCCGFAP